MILAIIIMTMIMMNSRYTRSYHFEYEQNVNKMCTKYTRHKESILHISRKYILNNICLNREITERIIEIILMNSKSGRRFRYLELQPDKSSFFFVFYLPPSNEETSFTQLYLLGLF